MQNDRVTVSAIITTHNRIDDLKKAIDSVRQQTYKTIECIVVDDASNDETQKWMEKNISSWLKYIRINKEDSHGGNYARNLGLYAAKGEYVAYLDDDDSWFPRKIEKQVEVANKNAAGVIYCGRRLIKRDGTVDVIPKTYFTGDLKTKIYTKIIATTSTLLIKRSILLENGGFDEKLSFWQETELLMRLAQRTNFDCVYETLINYSVIEGANRLTEKYAGWIEAVEYIRVKHKIEQFDSKTRNKFNLIVHKDAVSRCGLKTLRKERKMHLRKILELENNFSNFICYVFNLDNKTKNKITYLFVKLHLKQRNLR